MKLFKEKLLSSAQLKRLGEHKYSCCSVSLLDPFLQPYWTWLVARCPIWLAPNLITILGLLVNIVTTLILVWWVLHISFGGWELSSCLSKVLTGRQIRGPAMGLCLMRYRTVHLSEPGCYRWQTSQTNWYFKSSRRTFRPRMWFYIDDICCLVSVHRCSAWSLSHMDVFPG